MIGGFLGQRGILYSATIDLYASFRLLAHGSRLRDYPRLSLPNTRVSRGNSAIRAHGFKTRGLWWQRSMEQDLELVLFRHGKLFLVWREYYLLLQGTYTLCDLFSSSSPLLIVACRLCRRELPPVRRKP